ncbi:MAG: SGNH/GDSL hydrolase family protein [Syntrophomonas sp.]
MNANNSGSAYKIIVSGDSISKGVVYDERKNKYIVLENNYISLLQRKLNGVVYNTARFGNTIIKGFSKLRKDLPKYSPDIAFIEYGGNDCDFNWYEVALDPGNEHLPNTDFNGFQNQLKEIINFLKNNRITSVVMTLPPLNADRYLKWISKNNPLVEGSILNWLGSATKLYWWQERYSSAIQKVAEECNIKCIDIRGAFLQYADYTQFLCLDGIHPNEAGHEIIANKIIDYIKSGYDYLLKSNDDKYHG